MLAGDIEQTRRAARAMRTEERTRRATSNGVLDPHIELEGGRRGVRRERI